MSPIALSEEDILDHAGDLLVCWGIFNPRGPTWSCLGRLRTASPDCDLLFYRMLSPFHQDSVAFSSLVGADRADGRLLGVMLHELFVRNAIRSPGDESLPLIEGAPTFVLIPWENADFRRAAPDFFRHSRAILNADLATSIDYITRYPGRPWDRAAAEIMDVLAAFRSKGVALPSADQRSADAALVEKWYDLINQPEHLTAELAAFPAAWQGAITELGSSPLAQDAFPLSALDQFLAAFGLPVFRQAAFARLDSLIAILERLRDAVGAHDRQTAREVVDAFVTRLTEVYGDSNEVTIGTLTVLETLKSHVQAEDYDEAIAVALAILSRFREARFYWK